METERQNQWISVDVSKLETKTVNVTEAAATQEDIMPQK